MDSCWVWTNKPTSAVELAWIILDVEARTTSTSLRPAACSSPWHTISIHQHHQPNLHNSTQQHPPKKKQNNKLRGIDIANYIAIHCHHYMSHVSQIHPQLSVLRSAWCRAPRSPSDRHGRVAADPWPGRRRPGPGCTSPGRCCCGRSMKDGKIGMGKSMEDLWKIWRYMEIPELTPSDLSPPAACSPASGESGINLSKIPCP